MTFSLVENNKLVHPLILTEVPEEDFVCVCVRVCVGGGGGEQRGEQGQFH